MGDGDSYTRAHGHETVIALCPCLGFRLLVLVFTVKQGYAFKHCPSCLGFTFKEIAFRLSVEF